MHHLQHHRENELDRHYGHLDHHHDGHLDHDRHEAAHSLAKGLGWFSIALGALELAAPQALARTLGMRGTERMIQACGMREIAAGIGILASRNPAPWLWARVAGDGLDLAGLATGLHHGNRQRRTVQIAMGAVGAVTLLDIFAAQRMSQAAKTMYLPKVDYSDRDGYPKGIAASRGAARDFEDRAFSTPDALKPWTDGKPQNGWSEPGGGARLASASGSALTGAAASGGAGSAALGETVERDTSVFGTPGGKSGQSGLAAVNSAGQAGRSGTGAGGLQQAAGSHERDDAFKTGSSFTGSGNEGP
jgi:hypothetical protein